MRNLKYPSFSVALYVPILGMSMLIMTGRLFAYAGFLSADQFGVLSVGFLVSSTFGMLAGFGTYIELQRQLPMLYRRKRNAKAFALIANSLLINGVLLASTCAIILGYFIATRGESNGIYCYILIFGAFNGYFQQAFLIVSSQSKSQLNIFRYASQNLARAILVVFVGMLAAWMFKSAVPILAGELFATFSIVIFIFARQVMALGVRLQRFIVILMGGLRANKVSTLFILSMLSVVSSLSISLDRWIGAYVLDIANFGEYSFALTIMLSALYLQSIINASAFPIFALKFTEMGKRVCLRDVTIFSVSLLIFSLFASTLVYPILQFAVSKFFSNYSGVNSYLYLLLIAASFRVSEYFSSYMVISKNERRSLTFSVAAVVISVGLTIAVFCVFAGTDMELLMAFFTATLAVSSFLVQLAASYIGVDRSSLER